MNMHTITDNPEISELTEDIAKQKYVYDIFLNNKKEDMLKYMFSEGYILPMNIKNKKKYGSNVKPFLEKRKENLTKRYKLWKNMRQYFKEKYKNGIKNIMYPGQKKMILDVSRCSDTRKAIQSVYDLIVNYIPFYDIYMYNPIPGAGYKYYTGENIIIYHIGSSMSKTERNRVSKAAREECINGYKNQWRVIITDVEYKGLSTWYRSEISNSGNLNDTIMLGWKCIDDPILFQKSFDLVKYAKMRGIQPWPYRFKTIPETKS